MSGLPREQAVASLCPGTDRAGHGFRAMKIPALSPLVTTPFLLLALAACAGDRRLTEQAERLTVEEETVALAAPFPEDFPGRAALAGEVDVAPVAVRPGVLPLEAEAIEDGLRRSLERTDLLAEGGGLFSQPQSAYRLALNIDGFEAPSATQATLSSRYILLDADGRIVWSEAVETSGTAPAGSATPARDAAEEAMRQSVRRMLGALEAPAPTP